MVHIENFAKYYERASHRLTQDEKHEFRDRVGCAWSPAEEQRLERELRDFAGDHNQIDKIMKAHGRTARGIASRAERLHLEELAGLRARPKDRIKWGLYREGLIDYIEYARDS